ncbi:hypothetical protein GCM10028805_01990 [Spirosoma harenae]
MASVNNAEVTGVEAAFGVIFSFPKSLQLVATPSIVSMLSAIALFLNVFIVMLLLNRANRVGSSYN